MNNPIINLEGVDLHQMSQQVFSNITLKIDAGEFIYLIGETGSGKSSLLKAFYGELKVSAGNITLAGINLNKIKSNEIPNLRRKLGIVFQDFQLLTDRTVEENLKFVMRATGWKDKKKVKARTSELLEKVGMAEKGYKFPHQLSGGEQQRIAIARALINDPDIIFADEMTGNLDQKTSDTVFNFFLEKIKSNSKTLSFATHDKEYAKLADKIFQINKEDLYRIA